MTANTGDGRQVHRGLETASNFFFPRDDFLGISFMEKNHCGHTFSVLRTFLCVILPWWLRW